MAGIEPVWLDRRDLLALHERQIVIHGGGEGIRSIELLGSAAARPFNLYGYGEPDMADVAAAYVFGIARNHPFVDGNKRTAWVAARLFLRLNEVTLTFDKADAIRTMIAIAAGKLGEDELADWFRAHIASKRSSPSD